MLTYTFSSFPWTEVLDKDTLAVKDFDLLETMELMKYLESNHTLYLNSKLPELEQSMHHVFGAEELSPVLRDLVLFFNAYKKKLVQHIEMEENVFFPLVKRLLQNKHSKQDWESFLEFTENHDDVEEDLAKVVELIQAYSKENSLPLSYRIFLRQIENFNVSLNKHAFLEDEILLPRIHALMANMHH